jgi:hypothetical protein
LTGLH